LTGFKLSEGERLARRNKGEGGKNALHVEIEVKVVEVLAVDEKVEHVVTLPADLKTRLDPIDRRRLEEFRRLELTEEVLLGLRLRLAVAELVENVALEL
jgi:hypothetical protein